MSRLQRINFGWRAGCRQAPDFGDQDKRPRANATRLASMWVMLFWLGMASLVRADEADILAAKIDEHIAARWHEQKVEPATVANDAEFLRRVWLDLAGRIPTAGQAREFLEDTREDKRRRLIDKLLDSGAFVGHFTRTWREAWLPKQDTDRFPAFAARFDDFLRDRLRRGAPYDQIVREIITSPTEAAAAKELLDANAGWPTSLGFFEANERQPEVIAASAAKDFLGVRIDCAQCHDHPFGEWKREQFWQLAAFFSDDRTDREPSIKIPELGKVVPAKFLNGQSPKWAEAREPNERVSREMLAEWITSPSNPFFAKAAVNRVWSHCFGVGLIEPVDDMNSAHAPSHPALLDDLAQSFVDQRFDLKFLLRGILRSRAYSLTSRRTHESQDNPSDFARMSVKTLTAEQLFDSVIRAAGYSPTAPLEGPRDRRTVRSEFLARFASTERPVDATTSIPQALTRMNGALTTLATDVASGPLLMALREAPYLNDQQRVDELFLATYSRLPTSGESRRLTEYVSSGGPQKDRAVALADILWALLNSHEFSVNH